MLALYFWLGGFLLRHDVDNNSISSKSECRHSLTFVFELARFCRPFLKSGLCQCISETFQIDSADGPKIKTCVLNSIIWMIECQSSKPRSGFIGAIAQTHRVGPGRIRKLLCERLVSLFLTVILSIIQLVWRQMHCHPKAAALQVALSMGRFDERKQLLYDRFG